VSLHSRVPLGRLNVKSVKRHGAVLHCRILNVGPDPDARRLLRELAQTEAGVLLQQIETGSDALDALKHLPESELPNIVIIPFRLAILTSLDFIFGMQSEERLSSIPVLVWGPRIEPWEMGQLYTAGAASVLLGDFDATHLNAMRNFCRSWTGLEPVVTVNSTDEARNPSSRKTDGQSFRDVRLGRLFLWTGSTSAAFWVWSVIQLGASYRLIDLLPIPIYASLTCAGLFLTVRRARRRMRTQIDHV